MIDDPQDAPKKLQEAARAVYGLSPVDRPSSDGPQLHHAGNTSRLDDMLQLPDWIEQKFNAFETQQWVKARSMNHSSELVQ
jgi:hypothetical protein